MNCPTCNTSNPDTARFCLQCGATLSGSGVSAATQEVTLVRSNNEEKTVVDKDRDPLLGTTIAGKYRLEAKLGAGGMGSVYRATRVMIGDEVAVKVLHSEHNDPKAAERFQREAQAAARLKHPNAVAIHDFGITEEGSQYLVMDLVEGESLRQIIKREGPLTPSASGEIITQVCAALDEAHRHHIVHRDIKPDNIIVNITANGLRVKVLDFGIAKLRDDVAANLTQTGSILGTPHYMSPEQCLGEELDARSDIYSLGIVTYEMLTGLVPFNSPTSSAVVVQHVTQAPTPLRALNTSISETTESAVLRALEKQRQARPQTAGEFAREFQSANTSLPLQNKAYPLNSSPSSHSTGDTVVLTRPTASTGEIAKPHQRPNIWPYIAAALGIVVLVGIGVLLVRPRRDEATTSALPDPTSLKVRASASSTRLPSGGVDYDAANTVDGNFATAWDEGVSGPGIGEWIQCDFENETAVIGIRLAPGYFKNARLWRDNNRLAVATLYFSDGTSRNLNFADQMQEQAFEFGNINTRWVRLRIDRIYAGSSDTEDTPISEIAFIRQGQSIPVENTQAHAQTTPPPSPRASEQPREQEGTWFVVLGSFPKSQYAKANERMQLLQRTGYSATIIDTDNYPGLKGGLWTVVLGPYSKSHANQIAAEVRSVRPDVYVKSGW
jgi:serine/threonine protein kinase